MLICDLSESQLKYEYVEVVLWICIVAEHR